MCKIYLIQKSLYFLCHVLGFLNGVPIKCETKSKRNETKRNETNRNETKPIETKRNRSKPNETKPKETKIQNQNEMKNFKSSCFRLL
jgi:hypothetical protein